MKPWAKVRPSLWLVSMSSGTRSEFPAATAALHDRALAAVGNLLAPRRVIVIGPMAQAGELVLEPVRTVIRRHIAPSTVPEIVLGALGARNTPLGAIALAPLRPGGC